MVPSISSSNGKKEWLDARNARQELSLINSAVFHDGDDVVDALNSHRQPLPFTVALICQYWFTIVAVGKHDPRFSVSNAIKYVEATVY